MLIKRALWHILLAAMLLVAQHVALAHGAWHFKDRPSGSQQHDGGKQSTQPGSCDLHVAFATVLGALASAVAAPAIAGNRAERTATLLPARASTDLIVPASRGPPILL